MFNWGYGATAARLTPDQKVGSSNLSGLTHVCGLLAGAHPQIASAFPGDKVREQRQFHKPQVKS